MLPIAYATPAAVVLVVGGLLSCFAGYRLFRVVLGMYGFILGAALTTSALGAGAPPNTLSLVLAAMVGGVFGAVLAVAAYFVGVGLIGAGLAALLLDSGWRAWQHTDPPTLVLVVISVLGALGALSLVRWVVIFGTALGGSWTTILGAIALAGDRVDGGSARASVWLLNPLGPVPTKWWVYAGWFALALMGAIIQLATTSKLAGPRRIGKRG